MLPWIRDCIMTTAFNFTQQRLEKLPVPLTGRVDYYDVEISKLICRVSASGHKSFCVLKRLHTGKLQRVTLGKWPDVSVAQARKLASETLVIMQNGINPNDKKRADKLKSITLGELLTQYLELKALKPGTMINYREKLKEGFSDWLTLPVKGITKDMVTARYRKLTGSTTTTTRDNKLRVLRVLMKYAVATGVITESPTDVLKVVGLWSKPAPRKQIIPSTRLKDWTGAVLKLKNQKAKVYLLLLLYTGLRAREALHLQWADIDFTNNCLTVRDTKNHSDFTTYMPSVLKVYLRDLQALTGDNVFCFPGADSATPMAIPRCAIRQITQETGIEFCSHDLRRTFATACAAALLPLPILKSLLNHTGDTKDAVTLDYIQTEESTLKKAVDRVAAVYSSFIQTESDNVVSLTKAL